jgi:DNA-binding transcriptional LysR family regulator
MGIRITLRQLEYFIAAGECRSITGASDRIGISPPSISMAVSHLEQEFALQLFVRHHAQGLSLTAAGIALLAEAKQVVHRAEALNAFAIELSGSMRGELAVGCLVTLAPMILPELTHSFAQAHAAIDLRAREDNQKRLLEDLLSADLDVVITYDLDIPTSIEFHPLASLPPHALVAADHHLADRGTIALHELRNENYLLLDLPLSSQYFMSLFHVGGFEPNIGYRSASQEVIRTMVANGQGYTLINALPRSDMALDGRRLARLKLADAHRPMTIGIARRADVKASKVVQAFEDHCRLYVNESYIAGMDFPGTMFPA